MADVFEVLSADHSEVKQMLAQIETIPGRAAGANETQLAARAKLVERLVIEESKHEAVEEMYFWPTVRERVAGGNELADHAISQENEAKEVLDKLDKMAANDPQFDELLVKFMPAALEHIAYEENQVWPALRQVLSPSEAEDLGSKLSDAKKTAPTRPHPSGPDSPGALKAAGPAVTAADKLRDVMTGRGKD